MPVRFTVAAEEIAYLIPAPFVNINKTFDKQGDGEILGSRYSIQLKGYIVADRGSPKGDGTFIADGVDVIEAGLDADDWYKAIQKKQKALSNLISKVKAGAYLEIQPPNVGEDAGFSAHVRLESVDLPTHNPGDPFKAEYTINLSADYIIGPTGDVNDDEDDWNRQDKWLISAASENWSIQESDKFVFEREKSDNAILSNSKKAFELTRTISATGKNKFKDSTAYADGLEIESGGNPIPNGFSQIYAKNGKAWQQARGYIYDIVRYGNQFLFGKNDTEYTDHLPTTSLPLEPEDGDPDDYHLFAMNLPVPDNGASSNQQYKAFNYKRSQTVDAKGGSFSVTETWMLMPSSAIVTETMEFSTQEDDVGKVTVTVNGSIEGLVDNADNVGVGEAANKDKDAERKEPVDEVFNYLGDADADPVVANSKYQNALSHYAQVIVGLHSTIANVINDLTGYKRLTVNPTPTSKTSTQQPGNGIITYSVSYEAKKGGFGDFIPYVKKEEFSVSDTYPGQVYAEHVVLGRKLGPVLQDVGTQTHWLREVSLSCTVDVDSEKLCVNPDDDILSHDTEEDCIAQVSGTCSISEHVTQSACEGAVPAGIWTSTTPKWIFNPNYINLGTSNPLELTVGSLRQGVRHTTDIITAKPGSAPVFSGTGAPDDADGHTADDFSSPDPTTSKNDAKRHQYVAIKKLLNSLDPLTYLHADFDGQLVSDQHVTKRFTNAPSESWNPKTGAWSYSISWVYEVDDPYTTAASSWFINDSQRGAFDDGRYLPDRQNTSTELPRTAPGQSF